MRYSSEFVSSEYMHLNNCGIHQRWYKDYYCTFRPNGRKDYHILYIFKGKCYAEIDGAPITVDEGSMILYKPNERQKYEFFKEDKSISCYIHFTGTGCEKLLNDIGFDKTRVIHIGKSKSVMSFFVKMEKELCTHQPLSEQMCAAHLCELLSYAGRRYALSDNEIYLKNKQRIQCAIQYMYDNYAQNLSVKDCAETCHLSASRFAHIFKEAMGKSPLEYLTEIRISKAKELLSTCSMPISEIAVSVGFWDQNYFARIFKQQTGMSPKQYASSDLQ